MSVRTTADEKLDSAREKIKEALADLHTIVIEECWGHDDYKVEYRALHYDAYIDLLQVYRKLNR